MKIYKGRTRKPVEEERILAVGYSKNGTDKPTLGFMSVNSNKVEVSIEEAKRIIETWSNYIRDYKL